MQLDFAERFNHTQFLMKVVDVSKKKEVLDFAQFIENEWGRVDILVNNAGVYLPGSISTEAEDVLETLIATNLYSMWAGGLFGFEIRVSGSIFLLQMKKCS